MTTTKIYNSPTNHPSIQPRLSMLSPSQVSILVCLCESNKCKCMYVCWLMLMLSQLLVWLQELGGTPTNPITTTDKWQGRTRRSLYISPLLPFIFHSLRRKENSNQNQTKRDVKCCKRWRERKKNGVRDISLSLLVSPTPTEVRRPLALTMFVCYH